MYAFGASEPCSAPSGGKNVVSDDVEADTILRYRTDSVFEEAQADTPFGRRDFVAGETRAERDDSIRLGLTRLARDGWYVRAMAQRAADLDQVLERLSAGWWRSCEVPNPGCSKLGDLPAGSPPSQAAHF
jgi:hypothetical protein